MTEVYLCSFASPDLTLSVNRFVKQSKELNFYKEIKVFGWDDLSKKKQEQINTFINKGQKRLFGYASWKPEIILSYLNKIPTNSILQYSDIGCFFNPKGIKRLNDYVKIAQEKDFLAFKYIEPDFDHKKNFKFQVYYEYQYTKADAWTYLNIEENSPILQSEQIWSGTMFFKNNSYAKNLLNNWMEACDNNNLIDDSDSIEKNHEKFIEHRHDQSIFSLICKKEKVYCLSASECEWAEFENDRTWTHLDNYPILAKRGKRFNFFKRFIIRQTKNIKRFLKI